MFVNFKQFFIAAAVVGGIYLIYTNFFYTPGFDLDLSELSIVEASEITELSIVHYPEEDVYSTYDSAVARDLYGKLAKIELEDIRRFKETDTYYKVNFSDTSKNYRITYYFYDNGQVMREEYGFVTGKGETFKTKDTAFYAELNTLLESEKQ